MNESMALIHISREWLLVGRDERNINILVALLQELSTALQFGDDLILLGCLVVPKKVLEDLQKIITVIGTSWNSNHRNKP